MGVTREEFIRRVAADLFWNDMARKPEDRTPLDADGWNSLFLSCLVNRGIQWERAMGSATELGFVAEMKLRTGITNTLELFTSNNTVMLEWLAFDDDADYSESGGRNGSLLRYRYTSDHCHQAMCKIRDQWGGSAANLHRDEPNGSELLKRVMSFKGYGSKTASLYCRVAVLGHSAVLWNKYAGLDISPDRHCSRVMQRLGLVAEDSTPQEVIKKARELSPTAPVEMDGLFMVGLDFACGTDHEMCLGNPEGEQCPLLRVCPSHRR